LRFGKEQRGLSSMVQPIAINLDITVLLVEDEEMMRNMAKAMLNRLGVKVLCVYDGIEAIEVFQKHYNEINVVITDLNMPHMNGLETLSVLRRIRPNLPMILVSGHDESIVITDNNQVQDLVFLQKPYQKIHLKDALVRVMKKAV